MNKNTIIGFVLIGVVLVVFSWLNRPTPEQLAAQQRYNDSIAQVEMAQKADLKKQQQASAAKIAVAAVADSTANEAVRNSLGAFANAMTGKDDSITLQNDKVEIRISNKGGSVSYARLKEYDRYDKKPLVLFNSSETMMNFTLVTASNRVVNTSNLYFTPVKGDDPNSLTMRLAAGDSAFFDIVYSLKPGGYMLNIAVKGTGLNTILIPSTNSLDINWAQKLTQQEKGRKFEDRYAAINYSFVAGDFGHLHETKDDSKQISNRLRWIGYKDMFFSSVFICDGEGFSSTNVEQKMMAESTPYLKDYKTTTTIPFDLQGKEATNLRFYFGPNKFSYLQSLDKGLPDSQKLHLEKLVPLGWSGFRWINQYFIIPLFNFLSKYISNYGIIILLITIIVKMILYPLTRKSYMSSAKMRVLRPQVEELNAKYPGQDQAMERQKATMDLYSRAGASPMSGCLPMLLSMPVLIALFWFFPTAIELRHQSFLWASDLSTYDAIVSWEGNIPFITSFYGNHISLFCLLMTVVNIIYTKWNMDMTNTGQQQMPGMKLMMYFMPVFMMFFFNQYASGLTYYYFISLLITIIQTLGFRYHIDEAKLLAQLEENKKKPMKRSGFMARLEEAQRKQQQTLEHQKETQEKQRKARYHDGSKR